MYIYITWFSLICYLILFSWQIGKVSYPVALFIDSTKFLKFGLKPNTCKDAYQPTQFMAPKNMQI